MESMVLSVLPTSTACIYLHAVCGLGVASMAQRPIGQTNLDAPYVMPEHYSTGLLSPQECCLNEAIFKA